MSGADRTGTTGRAPGAGKGVAVPAAGRPDLPLGIKVQLVALGAMVGLRFPPRLPVSLLRRVLPRVGGDRGAERADAMADLVPAGIAAVLDEPYGDGRAQQRLDVFWPEADPRPLPTLVWVHGGGWIGGTKNDLRAFLQIVAGHGFTTVGVDYSWAPGAHYPTQVHQVRTALEHLGRHARRLHVASDRLVLGGDSAGAHIAAQLALAVRDRDYAAAAGLDVGSIEGGQVVASVLACGPYTLRPPDLRARAGRFEDLLLRAYTGRRRYLSDPVLRQASLSDTVTAAFPPAFITAGTVDPMLPSSRELSASLNRLGVPVDALFFPRDHRPELPHEYQFELGRREAKEALDRIVAHLHRFAGPATSHPPAADR